MFSDGFQTPKQLHQIIYANNIYFGAGATSSYGGGSGAESGSGGMAATRDNVHAEPGFVNPSLDYRAADFHPGPGSPAIKAGSREPFSPLTDLDVKQHPFNEPPTVGAFKP